MLELALKYLHQGYVVIPVGKNKRPLIDWKEYQTEWPLEKDLEGWWKQYPEAQIGIVTGEISGLTVVDVEKDGDASIFLGLNTYTVKTGGGGYHFYFDYEPTVKNSVRTLPLTDIRSEGGYVVAAGSTTEKGNYEVVKDVSPMKMPEAIRVLFEKKAVPFNPQLPRTSSEPIVYDGVGEGGRNDSLTRYAGKVLATMAPAHWETVAWPMILEANKKNSPPLAEWEVRAIFTSISERESPKTGERRYGERRDLPTSRFTGSVPELSPVGEGSIMTLEEAKDSQVIDVDKTTPTNITIFDEALMGGFSPGDLIIIAGRSGVGKTTFAQDLTASFLTAGSGVLWFSYEVMATPLYRKFQEMGLGDDEFSRLYVPTPPMTSDLSQVRAIAAWARKEKNTKLLVVDHIGFLDLDVKQHGNHATAVTHLVRGLKTLAVEEDMHVILPVHVRKVDAGEPSLEDVRDSYGVVQEADAVFLIDRKRASTAQEREKSYYSDNVRIALAKNRKTGVSKTGTFSLLNGRYAYEEALSKADEAPEMGYRERNRLKKEADAKWDEMTAGMAD